MALVTSKAAAAKSAAWNQPNSGRESRSSASDSQTAPSQNTRAAMAAVLGPDSSAGPQANAAIADATTAARTGGSNNARRRLPAASSDDRRRGAKPSHDGSPARTPTDAAAASDRLACASRASSTPSAALMP